MDNGGVLLKLQIERSINPAQDRCPDFRFARLKGRWIFCRIAQQVGFGIAGDFGQGVIQHLAHTIDRGKAQARQRHGFVIDIFAHRRPFCLDQLRQGNVRQYEYLASRRLHGPAIKGNRNAPFNFHGGCTTPETLGTEPQGIGFLVRRFGFVCHFNNLRV